MDEPVDSPALGSLRSWVLDAILGGMLLPPCALLALFASLHLIDGGGNSSKLPSILLWASVIGAVLGLVVGTAAWVFATAAWRIPLAALAAGPVLGAFCAFFSMNLLSVALDGHWARLSTREALILLGFGAFAVGPVWVAYLAVRARGRKGTPTVIASALWAACTAALVVLLYWLRENYYPFGY